MAIYELNQLNQPCKSIKKEAFKDFLNTLREELSNYRELSKGQQIFEIAQKVAERFFQRYPRIGQVLETHNPECKRFYRLLSEEQLKALRDLFKELDIEVETQPLKRVIFDYLCENLISLAPKLTTKGREMSPQEAEEIIKRTCEGGTLPKLVNQKGSYKVRVATARIATSWDERASSDPWFFTFVMNFEPYGVTEDLSEGKFEEDIKEFLKEKVISAVGEYESNTPSGLSKYIDPEEELEGKEEQLDRFVEDLFDAIDTAVRDRFILNYFERLLNFSENYLPEEKKNLLETLKGNLEILKELAPDMGQLWGEVVRAIPVGFTLLEKITDYLAEKNFRRFLYTYKLKLNDIAEGAAKQFLDDGEGKVKVKTRADYFKIALRKLEKRVNDLLKETNPQGDRETILKLTRWAKALLKAYFFYSKGKVDSQKVLRLVELIQQLSALREESLKNRKENISIPVDLLKELKGLIRNLKRELDFTTLHNLYEEIKQLLRGFIEEELTPDGGEEFYVAVDFDTLARDIARYIRTGEREPRTRLYPPLVRVLSEEERSAFTYILKVRGYARNLPMALEKESVPQEGLLTPKKETAGWFNLTYNAADGKIELKHTYKLAFALTFFALGGYIAERSEGLLIGANLPFGNYKADFLHDVNTALFFAVHSFRDAAIQHFNWSGIGSIPINLEALTKGASIKSPAWSNRVFVKIKNALTSLLSNLPHEVESLGSLEYPVAVLFLSNPVKVDDGKRALVGELYLFTPKGETGRGGKTLFQRDENTPNGFEVHRRTLFEVFDYVETPQGESPNLGEKYFQALEEMLKGLEGVQKVYIVPPLPIYRGLSTKEVLYRGLYSAKMFAELMDKMGKELKLLFSSYGVVYTPHLGNLKRRIRELLKKYSTGKSKGGSKETYVALNLFKNAERIVDDNREAKPVVVPKFAVIPLLSLQADKDLFHHAFIYSTPLPSFVGEIYSDRLLLTDKDKQQLLTLLGAIHIIRYEKYEHDGKFQVKTLKRNPIYVHPERRSGDKNIFALTGIEIGKEGIWESLLTAFEVVKALRGLSEESNS